MRRFLMACLIYACILLGGAAISQAVSSFPSGPPIEVSGTLVFARGSNIWTMNANGTNQVQLTHLAGEDFANNPKFSPDGSVIAYVYHVAPTATKLGAGALHVMRADGSDDGTLFTPQVPGESIDTPAWVADGQHIYFGHDVPTLNRAGQYVADQLSIDEVDVKGGSTRTVAMNGILPATSASGALAWVSYNTADATFELMLRTAGESIGHSIISSDDFQAIYSVRPSPDGRRLIFSASGRTDSRVAPAAPVAAVTSPFLPTVAEAHGLPWDVWTVEVDGTGLEKLVSLGSDEQSLAWMPDGQAIAVANIGGLYLVRPDGNGRVQILGQGLSAGLDWRSW